MTQPLICFLTCRHSVGNADVNFTLQSGGKCFSYAIAVDKYGADLVRERERERERDVTKAYACTANYIE